MNSILYLSKELTKLKNLFPSISCDYKFSEFDDSHIIIMDYSMCLTDNLAVQEYVEKIDMDFIEIYPNELLTFYEIGDDISMFNNYTLVSNFSGVFYNLYLKSTSNIQKALLKLGMFKSVYTPPSMDAFQINKFESFSTALNKSSMRVIRISAHTMNDQVETTIIDLGNGGVKTIISLKNNNVANDFENNDYLLAS
jgi:hypothetical protein